ncbi:hypothetical protein ACSXAP_06915 [Clostridium perfringens]
MAKINQDKLIEILNEKWKGRPCNMCGDGNWIVSDKIFELREFNDGDLIIGGVPIQPVVTITCKNCGNTVLVNPLAIGVLDEKNRE